MLEKFLHEEIMRSGLNDYLNMHMYSNAETKDLWDVFSKHANQSLEVKVYSLVYFPYTFLCLCFYLISGLVKKKIAFNLGHNGFMDESNGLPDYISDSRRWQNHCESRSIFIDRYNEP